MPWDRAGQGLGVKQGKGRALGQGKGRAIAEAEAQAHIARRNVHPHRAVASRTWAGVPAPPAARTPAWRGTPYGVAAAAGALARGLASLASSPLCAGDSIPGPIASELRRSSERTSCSSPMMEPSGSSRRICAAAPSMCSGSLPSRVTSIWVPSSCLFT